LENHENFLNLILDSVSDHIVVINEDGDIQYVNHSWLSFGGENSCTLKETWIGINYLKECDKAADMGDSFGIQAANGIKSVIKKERSVFYFEYPCHSPTEKRWFMMRVTPFQVEKNVYFVISHQDITERKLAEEEVRSLARIDGLTGIANRRSFDEFFHEEWRRCARLKKNICLAVIDLDYFKLLNDSLGHLAGDLCLKKISGILKNFSNRPSDMAARYGGDEFVLVLGDITLQQARTQLDKFQKRVDDLKIENPGSPITPYMTVSIGVAEATPYRDNNEQELLSKADQVLYQAKSKGRNCVKS